MKFAIVDPLSHLWGTAGSPTADLYFAWSCARMLEDGRVRQLSPTVFQAERTLIVFRHAGKSNNLPKHDRLIYVMDDDWLAGFQPGAVPFDYGLKLALVEARAASRIERRADLFVVSSKALRRRYLARHPETDVELVEPYWPIAHAAPISPDSDPPIIAMLGGRSHARDALIVLPAIDAVLSTRNDVRFVISGEIPLPAALAARSNIERVAGSSWGAYRSWMAGRSFRLGLYPLRDTAFNHARSVNKLLEYDQFGSAVLASETWEAARNAGAVGRCILVKNEWRIWAEQILELLDSPGKANAIANRNRAAIIAADHSARQYAFWSQLLE